MATRFTRFQAKFLHGLRSEDKTLERLLKDLNLGRDTLDRWLRCKPFVRQTELILKRIRHMHRIESDLTAFKAAQRLAQKVRGKEPSVELLRKLTERTKRPAARKARIEKQPPLAIHPDVGDSEAAELVSTIRTLRNSSQN